MLDKVSNLSLSKYLETPTPMKDFIRLKSWVKMVTKLKTCIIFMAITT